MEEPIKNQGCCEPGRPVYLSEHDTPKRRLKYTWELIHMPDSLVGVNTQVPNRLVARAIERHKPRDAGRFDDMEQECWVE